jgi:hypothetical protein
METQDAVVIKAQYGYRRDAWDGITFDSLVVREDNKVIKCNPNSYGKAFLIGSQTHKVKFPIHINTQLFLRGNMLQSIDFEMPENSVLIFYDGNSCELASVSYDPKLGDYSQEQFYRDALVAINYEIFIDSSRVIDSSRGEIACWMIRQIDKGLDGDSRCMKWKEGQNGEYMGQFKCVDGL